MNDSQKIELMSALKTVFSVFDKGLSESVVEIWAAVLEGYTIEAIKQALNAHLRDPQKGQFCPKPADVIRIIDGEPRDKALIAWGAALESAARIGAHQSVAFDDVCINAAIRDCGGWVTFCRTDHSQLGFMQKRFTDAYQAYQGTDKSQLPLRLIGEHEEVNNGLAGISKNVLQITTLTASRREADQRRLGR